MSIKKIHTILSYCIATVWLINGLFCKVLHFVPRHQQIVTRILGTRYSGLLTLLIGLSEIGIAIWIFSGIKTRVIAWLQIIIVSAMNTIECILAPDLLLWGKANAIFALLFILLIYFNEFYLNKKLAGYM